MPDVLSWCCGGDGLDQGTKHLSIVHHLLVEVAPERLRWNAHRVDQSSPRDVHVMGVCSLGFDPHLKGLMQIYSKASGSPSPWSAIVPLAGPTFVPLLACRFTSRPCLGSCLYESGDQHKRAWDWHVPNPHGGCISCAWRLFGPA